MSQLEHSPEPWVEDYYQFEMNQLAWCIRDAQGGTVVEGNPYGSEPLDGNGKLLAAAPTMYRILRIILEDKRRPLGLIHAEAMAQAHRLIQELGGRSDAES
jgi:hypothetical protein